MGLAYISSTLRNKDHPSSAQFLCVAGRVLTAPRIEHRLDGTEE